MILQRNIDGTAAPHPASWPRTITTIDVHAEGEVGRVLVGAHLLVRGTSWPERRRWCETELDRLRPSVDAVEVTTRPSVLDPGQGVDHRPRAAHPAAPTDYPLPTGLTVGDIWSPVAG